MSHVLIQCSILNFEGGMPCVPVRTLASKGTLRTDCKLQKPVVLPHSFPSQNLAVSGICPCQVKLLPYCAPCFCKSASAIVPLCQTSLPFPCVRQHLTIAQEGSCPSEGREQWFILVLLHTLCVPFPCSESSCAHSAAPGHLLRSCLGLAHWGSGRAMDSSQFLSQRLTAAGMESP